MSVELILRCPSCGCAALAGDQFCEACGAAIAAPRDAARRHVEVDLVTVAGVTDRGLVHDRNEDALHLEAMAGGTVIAVCDGVSASMGSDVAAQVAATAAGGRAADALRDREARDRHGVDRPWDAARVVTAAAADAVAAVTEIPWLVSGNRDAPACTMVLALWDGLDITVGWLGDSRAYWADEHGCRPLTVDHSWAEEQVASERLSREAAEADGRAHAITRWLGADAPPGPCPIRTHRPGTPGRLIVCTDGLWNYTPEPADLARRLAVEEAAGDALTTARSLVRYALARGAHDNVTVAVAEIVPSPNGSEKER
jgi:serine/threonine protein phosphatase PrpC